MVILTTRAEPGSSDARSLIDLSMTAEQREKARQLVEMADGHTLRLHLPRGSVLRPGDVLLSDTGEPVARIRAEPEPVYTLRADDPFALLRAAYHLGNRHVAMELAPDYLRIKPDHVLAHLIGHLGGLRIIDESAAFVPEKGAYMAHHHDAH